MVDGALFNVSAYRGDSSLDIFSDGEKARGVEGILEWWVGPAAIRVLCRCHLGDTSGNAVMERFQGFIHGVCESPAFTSVEEDGLYHRFVEHSNGRRGRSISYEYSRHHPPPGLGFLEVVVEGRPVAVVGCYQASQIAEDGNFFQIDLIQLKGDGVGMVGSTFRGASGLTNRPVPARI